MHASSYLALAVSTVRPICLARAFWLQFRGKGKAELLVAVRLAWELGT